MDFSLDTTSLIIVTIITAATPLLLAALGELVNEKSGVLNLGLEGMMVVGAVMAFLTVTSTGSAALAIIVAILSGMGMALIFSVLTLSLQSNQVATGLALTIFGLGLSSLIGINLVGMAYDGLPKLNIAFLSDLPFFGNVLFSHDILVYFSIVMVFVTYWFLNKTKYGLVLRAVGESHDAAHSIGYPVIKIRYMAALYGGAMSGLAGAYLSLAYSPMWADNMTAGRGWIALALVVFAMWMPSRVLLGAYMFGGITILQLHGQGMGIDMPSEFLSMLPYLATIIVLVLISRQAQNNYAPACLGKPFHSIR
ncbi:ABC transporter permease [Thiomicrospira sp. XS5]|uniref:ABC transporter permease n=1 Tax=Thiomicrospira sp. XS5 TaxID=1775636 RepID=UPI00074AF2CE|nr:ABC transporter permease [Thiomicrospira sp. XS5]KUJ75575.1 ABC transporter permease [Thiomicrospira sp. XS5]